MHACFTVNTRKTDCKLCNIKKTNTIKRTYDFDVHKHFCREIFQSIKQNRIHGFFNKTISFYEKYCPGSMCCWLKQSFILIICKMAMEVKKNDDIVVTLIAFSRKHGHFAFRIKMWDMSIQCLYSLFYCSRTWCLCLWLGYLFECFMNN